VTIRQLNPSRTQPIRAAKHELLTYCNHQMESLFVRASLAEPGTRSGLISDWKQIKINREYIRNMRFDYKVHKRVHFLDEAA
jgi:hypothetical protein